MKRIDFTYKGIFKIRLKKFLLSRNFTDIRNIIKENRVLINKKSLSAFSFPFYLKRNDIVSITLPTKTGKILPVDKPIDIVYEDEYFLVINKPSNLATINTKKFYNDNLASRIIGYYQKINLPSTAHFVNRLDYLTCGLILVAKYSYIHYLFSKTKIIKRYYGRVKGHIKPAKKTVKLRIKNDELTSKRIVDKTGKVCLTKYKTLETFENETLLEFEIPTGRTHQIRVTMAYLNHPLINDSLYGVKETNGNLALQSYYLQFKHPLTKEKMTFKSPLSI